MKNVQRHWIEHGLDNYAEHSVWPALVMMAVHGAMDGNWIGARYWQRGS